MDNFYMLADLYCYKFDDKIYDCKYCFFFEDIEIHKKEILALLKDEDKNLVKKLLYSINETYRQKIDLNIADALNFGIKLGMELQEYFKSLYE